jgi:hypothetical protein
LVAVLSLITTRVRQFYNQRDKCGAAGAGFAFNDELGVELPSLS